MRMGKSSVTPLALAPLGVLRTFSRKRRSRVEGMTELNQTYRGTVRVLGDLVEADDGYTGAHSREVVALAVAVGERMKLSPEDLRDLEVAALLHDVGKVTIPKAIINKPGKLDPDEWRIVKRHTIEGQRILDRLGGFMCEVGEIVRSHHERWDGTGYPDGLAGTDIPLASRIIACCDAWNAMTTDRSYRDALSPAIAARELEEGAGTQFDPVIAEVLLSATAGAVEKHRSGLRVELLDRAVGGRLVLTPPQDLRAVADPAGADVVEAHLDDQLWPQRNPLEVATGGPAARVG